MRESGIFKEPSVLAKPCSVEVDQLTLRRPNRSTAELIRIGMAISDTLLGRHQGVGQMV